MAVPTTISEKAAALDTQIQGGVYASPPTTHHQAILNALRSQGVVTTGGSYAAGKDVSDVRRLLGVPTIPGDILYRSVIALGI